MADATGEEIKKEEEGEEEIQKEEEGKKEDASGCPTPNQNLWWSVFQALLAAGVLDAMMLTALACCSRQLRDSVEDAWAAIRAGTPTVVLKKVERRVDDENENKCSFGLCPVSQAGPCQACGKLTRFLHPILGTKLCPACGNSAEYRMISLNDLRKLYHISPTCMLNKHLRYAFCKRQEYTVTKQCEQCKTTLESSAIVSYHAPKFAANVRTALAASQRGSHDHLLVHQVFLRREVDCLMLELYGGPKMLKERIMNLNLPCLDVANPDA